MMKLLLGRGFPITGENNAGIDEPGKNGRLQAAGCRGPEFLTISPKNYTSG